MTQQQPHPEQPPADKGEPKKQCQWDTCRKGFASQEALIPHISHHLQGGRISSCLWVSCSQKDFKTADELLKHLLLRHELLKDPNPHGCFWAQCGTTPFAAFDASRRTDLPE